MYCRFSANTQQKAGFTKNLQPAEQRAETCQSISACCQNLPSSFAPFTVVQKQRCVMYYL